jgi:hypothetical protein
LLDVVSAPYTKWFKDKIQSRALHAVRTLQDPNAGLWNSPVGTPSE